jgi:hypothetical protein
VAREAVFSIGGIVRIRKAKLEDSAGLARVQVDSYRTAYADIFPQDYLDHFSYEASMNGWAGSCWARGK